MNEEIPPWLLIKATSPVGNHLAEVRQVGGASELAHDARYIFLIKSVVVKLMVFLLMVVVFGMIHCLEIVLFQQITHLIFGMLIFTM